jgi:ABC-type uncharacterized transport system ATPase subunit
MQDSNVYSLTDAIGYYLSEEGFHKLEAIRDQLLFMGTLAYPQKKHEEGATLEVTRETLGESYDVFARQIMDLIGEDIKRMRRVKPLDQQVN